MSVQQYLQHYAEPETRSIEAGENYYDFILSIPAFNEPDTFVERIKNLNTSQSVLVILVVNAPDQIDDIEKLYRTQALAKKLHETYPLLETYTDSMHLLELNQSLSQHLLLVERCCEGQLIPVKEGVGLARKIGCDIACKLIARARISCPWIFTTDADVSLPEGYFTAADSLIAMEVGAGLYPFHHQSNSDKIINLSQNLYELSLYYYVEGLRSANSLYAFHTIGSTLVINFHVYGLARGFPKRAAGEDFYLLNKMSKIADIELLAGPTINIDSRVSDRVPFGTGPAINKISQLASPLNDYLYYNPLCFEYLKACLLLLPKLWGLKELAESLPPCDLIEKLLIAIEADLSLNTKIDLSLLGQALKSLGANKALTHSYQHSHSDITFSQHMNNWFDAFKTLKFIHFIRENGASSINAKTLLAETGFLSNKLKARFEFEIAQEDTSN